ncbi:acetamidase/formamidase family protein [Paenibacillus silvae]|uniref:acetamidase/formamidase family protein n=1 Tax=Paenibacillus silvae TaxID=1325358 RepID=UPI00119CA2EF|nr:MULTISPECIES: acetamidase/formamidase family protein [Paenibacillus]MCK6073887.1 acetamidase/formamidase family protein [Paenibacillus silvae]MCK6148637.1 acetamidase/formamidase family protein [Paenibacillus silvae]MCK6266937.1 acetamidase/formamidase family protein [Paenibacillus silvae]
MSIHTIALSQANLVGSFTNEVKPVLNINSGDSIRFQTLDAGWGTGVSYAERLKPYPRQGEKDGGHALIGPICIEEAKQGKTLEIIFNEIVPGSYGFTSAGGYPNWQNQKLHLTQVEELSLNWSLDRQTMSGACEVQGRSYTVSLSPFLGVVGMPPESGGIYTTWPPRFCGGNIDCKELVQGSKLYLPIPVDGGYLAVGDGHARQGDGEVSCQAIECPMELVDITVNVIDDMPLTNPRAYTPSGWITFGFHEDLNEATVQALDGMLNLMGELYGLQRVEAIALGSAVVDLRITQIVNGVKGVHAFLPHDAFK